MYTNQNNKYKHLKFLGLKIYCAIHVKLCSKNLRLPLSFFFSFFLSFFFSFFLSLFLSRLRSFFFAYLYFLRFDVFPAFFVNEKVEAKQAFVALFWNFSMRFYLFSILYDFESIFFNSILFWFYLFSILYCSDFIFFQFYIVLIQSFLHFRFYPTYLANRQKNCSVN